MALRDVKEYYYNTMMQYLTMKEDLADFEQALADGYITEDKLEVVKADIAAVEQNYQRLAYIMFLFNLPQRKHKQEKFLKANTKLIDEFARLKADKDAVINGNKDILSHFKQELQRLSESNSKE